MNKLFWCFCIVVGISFVYQLICGVTGCEGLNNSNGEWTTVVVYDKVLEQEVSGADGNTTTENYYKVYTDKGAYKIELKGMFAHPSLVGKVNVGDTIQIKTMWFNAPVLGTYKAITDVRK